METGMHIHDVCTRLGSKVSTLGKSIHQLIRVSLRRQKPRSSDVEQWIAEFERLSGHGRSDGWHFDRNQSHKRR
jgi:hypothetical protein